MSLSLNAGLLVIAILAVLAAAVLGYQWYVRGAAVAALEQQLAGKDAELQSGAQRLAQLEARSAALEQQLRDQSVALEKMAYEDDLSGLPNRRAFDEALARSVARAQRGGHPLSLLLLDVPALAQIRQTHSDAIADLVVCDIGELLRRSLRASDMPARVGEKTFAVVLHDTESQEAQQVQQRLGRLFAQFDGWGGTADAGIEVTFTAAGVQWEEGDSSAAGLVQRAERRLSQVGGELTHRA